MIWAILEDKVVSNIIVAEKDFIKANKLNAICVDDLNVQIGAIYDGKNFTNPPSVIVEDEIV